MKVLFFISILLFSSTVFSQQELLTNGNFTSNNSGWTVTNDFTYNTTWSTYNFDIGYAYTSDDPNHLGTLEQEFTIPSNTTSATLSFYTNIDSDELTTTQVYDFCTVNLQIVGQGGTHEFNMLSNLDETNGYVNYTYTIPSNFFGEYVRLIFIFANDGATPTRFRFDNISLTANTSGGGTNPDYYNTNAWCNVTSVQAGNSIDVESDQGHQGFYPGAQNVNLGYYLSTDNTVSFDDHFFSNNIDYSNLTNGDVDSESQTLTIPSSTSTGQYYILFATDYDNQYQETNEANNVSAVPLYVNGNSAPAPTVELVYPNYYLCIPQNTPLSIQTNISGSVNGKKLEYSLDGGNSWIIADQNWTNSTSYSPTFITPIVNQVEECMLKITVMSNSGDVSDISDIPIAVTPPPQPEFFDFNGVSHISWPFEGSYQESSWRNGSYIWYGGSHHGDDKHICTDYYSLDYVDVGNGWNWPTGDVSATCQSPFYSPINGVVLYIGDATPSTCASQNINYGKQVVLQSNSVYDFAFRVAHLYSIDDSLAIGQEVNIGDLIGTIGSTGSLFPHAHCSLYKNIFVEINNTGNNLFDHLQTGNSLLVSSICDDLEFYSAEFEFDGSEIVGGGGNVGLSENISDNNDIVSVSPNPNNGTFKITVAEGLALERVTLFDSQNREYRIDLDGDEVRTHNLVPGIYYLHCLTTNGTFQTCRILVY